MTLFHCIISFLSFNLTVLSIGESVLLKFAHFNCVMVNICDFSYTSVSFMISGILLFCG